MTSILFEQKPKTTGPEPLVAAIYSVVPGVGQLYNGNTRKGIIFLSATFVSLLVLYATLNPESTLDLSLLLLTILKFMIGFIIPINIAPSPAAGTLVETIRFGSPFSSSIIVFIICFILYSMYDAYRDAEDNYRTHDYKLGTTGLSVLRFSESATSSYIIHSVFFSCLFLISLFLVFPKKDIEQVTEIEFIMPQIESKKPPPKTKRKSTVQSIDQGKNDPKKPVTPPQRSRPVTAPPKPVPKVVQKQMVQPPPPKPVAKPQPKRPIPKPAPKVSNKPALLPAQPKPAISKPGETANNAPRPVAPAPDASGVVGGRGTTSAKIAVVPHIPGGKGGIGNMGNPPPNSNPNAPPSIAAQKDLDFGPYMEELQRRIKRSWKPPRGNESKRVIVNFKIATNGSLSDLRIKKGSGFAPANTAALAAVRAAAPFARLPQGAPSIVDIEFTFDYNVFGAGR